MNNNTEFDLLKSYRFMAFGISAIVTNCIVLFVLFRNIELLQKSAFIAALAFGDLIEGTALLISGIIRNYQANNGLLGNLVHPSYCIKMFTPVYLLGNQIPGVMFFLIALERIMSVKYCNWYYNNWSNKLSIWFISMALSFSCVSVTIAAILVCLHPNTDLVFVTCTTPEVLGPISAIYNYGIAILGGSAAVVATLFATVSLVSNKKRLTTMNGNIANHLRNQWKVTRVMICLVVLDLAFVVLPSILIVVDTAYGRNVTGQGGTGLLLICARSALNIFVYFFVNSEFRRATLKAFGISRNGPAVQQQLPQNSW